MDLYLQKNEQDLYELLVLGANGEEYPKVEVEVRLKFWDRFEDQNVVLRSDKEGRIPLGNLSSVDLLLAKIAEEKGVTRSWKLGNCFEYPQNNIYQ